MLNCPVCSSELIRCQYEGLPVFNCQQCAGYLVSSKRVADIGRRRIKSEGELKEEALIDGTPDSLHVLRCPRCRRKMAKESWKSPDLFHVDKCEDCDLVWFDAGELACLQLDYEASAQGEEALRFQKRLREMSPEDKQEFEENLARLPEGDTNPLSIFGEAFMESMWIFGRGMRRRL